MIEGIRTKDVTLETRVSIIDMLEDEYPFYTDPMPNILFQRDPFATIGDGLSINNMMTDARVNICLNIILVLRMRIFLDTKNVQQDINPKVEICLF